MSTTRNPDSAPAVDRLVTPEIAASDLKAVRQFLTSYRDEERRDRATALAGTPLRLGIARARFRQAPRPGD